MFDNLRPGFRFFFNYTVTAGDYVKLLIILRGPDQFISFEAVPDGAGGGVFTKTLTSTETETYKSGLYEYSIIGVLSDDERDLLDTGRATVLADVNAQVKTDARTHAERVLDNIQAFLENRASVEQRRYEIAGRELERIPIPELLKLLDYYKTELQNEENSAAAEASGAPGKRPNKVYIKFPCG